MELQLSCRHSQHQLLHNNARIRRNFTTMQYWQEEHWQMSVVHPHASYKPRPSHVYIVCYKNKAQRHALPSQPFSMCVDMLVAPNTCMLFDMQPAPCHLGAACNPHGAIQH